MPKVGPSGDHNTTEDSYPSTTTCPSISPLAPPCAGNNAVFNPTYCFTGYIPTFPVYAPTQQHPFGDSRYVTPYIGTFGAVLNGYSQAPCPWLPMMPNLGYGGCLPQCLMNNSGGSTYNHFQNPYNTSVFQVDPHATGMTRNNPVRPNNPLSNAYSCDMREDLLDGEYSARNVNYERFESIVAGGSYLTNTTLDRDSLGILKNYGLREIAVQIEDAQVEEEQGYIFESLPWKLTCHAILETWFGGFPGVDCEVFAGGLPNYVTVHQLLQLFDPFGTIWEMKLFMDPVTKKNRGFAFVRYTSETSAQDCVNSLAQYHFDRTHVMDIRMSYVYSVTENYTGRTGFRNNTSSNSNRGRRIVTRTL